MNIHNLMNKQKLYNFGRTAFFFWSTCKKRWIFSQVCHPPELDSPQRTICQSAATAIADLSPTAYMRSTPKATMTTCMWLQPKKHLHILVWKRRKLDKSCIRPLRQVRITAVHEHSVSSESKHYQVLMLQYQRCIFLRMFAFPQDQPCLVNISFYSLHWIWDCAPFYYKTQSLTV